MAFALLLAAALIGALGQRASAHESDAELAAGTEAHAEADGITTDPGYAKQRWLASERARAAARKAWQEQAAGAGLTLLSDDQIRQRVLMQSLGLPVAPPQDGEGGFASESGALPINRAGDEVTAPTAEQLSLATTRHSTLAGPSRAVAGEWSTTVQPDYTTSPAGTFPNGSQYTQASYPTAWSNYPGDPIVNTDEPYTYDPDNPGSDNARYWSPNPRIVPIFEAMLPNGKVIYWDWYFSGNMTDPDQQVAGKKGTRILVWDPAHPDLPGVRKDVPGANLFCAGYAHLPNGDLLLAGGNANIALAGLKTTFVYHWRTGKWDQSADMDRIRWYPSIAATWNGESMIVGGDPQDENGNIDLSQPGHGVPEVFNSAYTDPTGAQTWNPNSPSSADRIRKLGALENPYYDQSKPSVPAWRLYPFIFPWTDGRVLYAGRETNVLTVDQRKHEAVENSGYNRDTDTDETDDGGDRYVTQRDDGANPIVRTYGTGAYYGLGKVIVTGGDEDKLYNFNVPEDQRGPGWPDYNGTVEDQDPAEITGNWVCKGYAGGNPYTYDANGNWTGDAPIVKVWDPEFCVGDNTVAPDVNGNNNHLHNGASKQAALVSGTIVPGEDDFGNDVGQGWPTSSQTASMHYPRRMANLTILPTGKLVSTGGMSTTNSADDEMGQTVTDPDYVQLHPTGKDDPDTLAMNANNANVNAQLVNIKRAVFAAEQWDPETGQWTVMASAHTPRMYHSTAVLLPDGRVMAGGGGVCSTCTFAAFTQPNFEYYSPPYLFNADGSLRSDTQRPRITGPFPSGIQVAGASVSYLSPAEYDDSFNITYAQADGGVPITKAAMVKLGAPTHGFDQAQRYVPVGLTVTSASSATIQAPANPFEAPPGYYMLFLIDQNGVPSVGRMIQVGASLPLSNKLRTATGYRNANLSDPDTAQNGTTQDFGLGSYRASHGNLTDIGDNSMKSLKILSGFLADVCRADNVTDCIRIPAGTYLQLGTRWSEHVSSIRIRATTNPTADGATASNATAFTNTEADETPPTIISPQDGTTTTAFTTPLNYTVTDDVSELDTPGSLITCETPSGQNKTLITGVNTFTIVCRDGWGNVASQPVTITRIEPSAPPPGPTTATPPPKNKLTVAKKVKVAKKLSFKAICAERCAVTIGITGNGLSYWPKAVMLKGSLKTQIVKFKLSSAVYKQIISGVKHKKKVKIRAWINDKPMGAGYFKR